MAKHYMNYGSISGRNSPLIPVDVTKHGQTFRNTHKWVTEKDSEGNITGGKYISLPFFDKAYISFTYGGKRIQDFGLNAVTMSDRLDRESPPPHEDYITQAKMLNGQYYWGSHYQAREMSISLATDGMTQYELDNFKIWFQPGEIRELIFAEHPNRGILARVSSAPQISMVPFQRIEYISINNEEREIKIIEYKGNIQLELTMDEPFWYAIDDVLGKMVYDSYGHSLFVDQWKDANGETISVLDNDGYKTMVEDHIPIGSMVTSQINFANGLRLQEYNARKYTLDSEQNSEALDGKNAPIANDLLDINYPLTGAIAGPVYRLPYQQDQIITSIPATQARDNIEFSSITGAAEERQYASNETHLLLKSIMSYIPIKKGSTIQYIGNKPHGLIRVVTYHKKNAQYEFDTIYPLDLQHPLYTAAQNLFIRITISVPINEWNVDTDGEFNFSTIAKLNLIIFSDSENIILTNNNNLSYFYSGTATSYPHIKFNVPIHFDNNGYIDTFSNFYSKHTNNKQYNILNLQSENKHELKLTTPAIFTAYNQVINILKNPQYKDLDIVSMIELLRNSVSHQIVRSWIINCINIYANNYNVNNNTEILIVDDDFKQQLLNYMPYLFVSFSEAGIEGQEGPPSTIQKTAEELEQPTFVRLNSRIKITTSNEILVNLGESFTIQVEKNNKALYYQWQYSKDKTKWFLIFDEENKWSINDETGTLSCLNVAEEDYGVYLRCIVSNSTSYTGTATILQIKQLNSNITITAASSSVTFNQGGSGTLRWNIVGNFLEEYDASAQLYYYPELYYYPKGTGTETLWGSTQTSSNNVNNYNGQIQNGKLTVATNKKSISFQFTALESATGKSLRNTKFKIRLYKIDAENKISSNSYVDSPLITMNLKRLEAINPVVSVSSTLDSYTAPTVTSFDKPIPIRAGSTITISITGMKDMIASKSRFQVSSDGGNKWTKITTSLAQPTIKATEAKLQWVFSKTWNDLNHQIRFVAGGNNNEIFTLPTNQTIIIRQLEPSEMDQEVDDFLNTLPVIQYGKTNFQQYAGDSGIKLSVSHETNVPPSAQDYSFTYSWYFTNKIIQTTSEPDWSNATKIYEVTNTNIINTFTFNNALTKNNQGWYKCEVKITVTTPSNEIQTRIYPDNSQAIYLNVAIIPTISNPQGSIINWTYYTKLNILEDQNGNEITIGNNWTRNLSYTITGDYSKITWYSIKNAQTTTINNNSNTYKLTATSTSNLVNIYNNMKYYCKVTDLYDTTKTYSSENTPITISIIIKTSKIEDIDKSILNFKSPDASWTWPCLRYYQYSGTANTPNGTISVSGAAYERIEDCYVNYIFTYNNNSWTGSGTAPTLQPDADNDDYVDNIGPLATSTTTENAVNTCLKKYENNINAWQTILEFPITVVNTYSQIKLKLKMSFPSTIQFKFKVRICQNNTVLGIEETWANNDEKQFIIEHFASDAIITLEILSYYLKQNGTTSWPGNIGGATGYSDNRVNSSRMYTPSNFPVINNFKLTLVSLQGISGTPNGSTSLMSTPKLMGNIVPRGLRAQAVSPTINQLCPISIDCATGQYEMKINYNTINWPHGILQNLNDPKEICYLSSLRYNELHTTNESIGDMILLNELVFSEQNHFQPITNKIKPWSEQDRTLCHKVTYDGDIPLQNFIIIYKNLYL